MNPWEDIALQHKYPDGTGARNASPAGGDSLIYPGLYSRSGLDVMGLLAEVATRPNPKIELGPIDCGVSLVVCDLELADAPIVYASDGFTELTGYTEAEVLGFNCRFLQWPGGAAAAAAGRPAGAEKDKIKKMARAVKRLEEVQVEVVNFRKDGTKFDNMVSIVPVRYNSQEYRYLMGFQAEV